jgi:hypothetical protein
MTLVIPTGSTMDMRVGGAGIHVLTSVVPYTTVVTAAHVRHHILAGQLLQRHTAGPELWIREDWHH